MGYDEERVERLVRNDGGLGFEDGLAALRLRPEADEPLPALVRLFLAREPIPTATAAAALGDLDLAELSRAGLISVRNGVVRARLALQPFEGLVLASDRSGAKPRRDHVVQIGPATRMLAGLTVRRRVDASLDLGTGSGAQAFLAARHSDRVVGLDLNPRALRLARLNAVLNDVGNVDWRQGDLFEPVRGERFGLVVANPPFVISPVQDLTYRDGGHAGDTLSRAVATGAAEHLAAAGFASILCNWVTEPGADPVDTPRRWLEGSGCDVWALALSTDDPVTYAVRWSALPGRRAAAIATAAEPWLADYRSRGIEAITTGVLVLRKSSGAELGARRGAPVPGPGRRRPAPGAALLRTRSPAQALGANRSCCRSHSRSRPVRCWSSAAHPPESSTGLVSRSKKGFPCRAVSPSPQRPSSPPSTGAGRSPTRSPLRLRRPASRGKRSRPNACRCCATSSSGGYSLLPGPDPGRTAC